MSKAYEKVGEKQADNLVYDNNFPIDTKSVTIRAGQGNLKRGTVLCLSAGTAGDSKFVKIGTTPATNETLTANCILCDDVDATASVIVTAYRTGHFAKNHLVGTLAEKDILALQNAGIVLSNMA